MVIHDLCHNHPVSIDIQLALPKISEREMLHHLDDMRLFVGIQLCV